MISTEQAAAAESAELVPARLLEGGEIVILAVKPSLWHILLSSWPVLVVAGGIIALMHLAGQAIVGGLAQRVVFVICFLAAGGRVVLGAMDWMGRFYVLTNRRVMLIYGILSEQVVQCPHVKISSVTLSASFDERIVGLGSLILRINCPPQRIDWVHVAGPQRIYNILQDAIHRNGLSRGA